MSYAIVDANYEYVIRNIQNDVMATQDLARLLEDPDILDFEEARQYIGITEEGGDITSVIAVLHNHDANLRAYVVYINQGEDIDTSDGNREGIYSNATQAAEAAIENL